MFTDTHCHINIMIKEQFDRPLTHDEIKASYKIVEEAAHHNVKKIINVGTSLIESENSLLLAQAYPDVFAAIGIHPNDATQFWQKEIKIFRELLDEKDSHKIVGIGECGIDKHYLDFNLELQTAVFKSHIELALEYNCALIVHSRDAAPETLKILRDYKNEGLTGTIHCFSYDRRFAEEAINLGFVLGIDGPITYPKNDELRSVVKEVGLENIILETDAPYLPPQIIRGKSNHPKYIAYIADYIAELLSENIVTVAQKIENNVHHIFGI